MYHINIDIVVTLNLKQATLRTTGQLLVIYRYHFNEFGLTTSKWPARYLKFISSQIRGIERQNTNNNDCMFKRTLKENDIREMKLSSDILPRIRAGQRDTVSKRCRIGSRTMSSGVYIVYFRQRGSGGQAGQGPAGQVLRKAPVGIPRAQTWQNVKVDTLVLLDPVGNWITRITGLQDQSTV